MLIFVKCKVITKSPNHPFLPHFLIFFNKGQETHNPQSAVSTPSYTATPKYRNIAYRRHHTATSPIAAANTAYRRRNIAYRCRKPRRPRRNIAYRRRKHRLSPPQTPPIAAANTAAPRRNIAALRRCRVLPRVRPPPTKIYVFSLCVCGGCRGGHCGGH